MLFVDCAPRLLHTSKHNSSQEYVRLRRRTVNIKYLQHGGIYCCRQNDVTGTHVCSFCFSVILLLVLLILFLVSREAFQAVPCCQQVVFCVLCSFMTSQPCVDTQLSSWICRSGTIKLVAIALFIRINGPFDMAAIKRNHVSSLLRNRVSKRPWHSACGTLIRQWIIIYHHPHYLSSSSGRARWTANLVALCLWRLHSCFRDLWPSRRIIHSLHALQTLKLTLFYCFFVFFLNTKLVCAMWLHVPTTIWRRVVTLLVRYDTHAYCLCFIIIIMFLLIYMVAQKLVNHYH